MAIAATAVEHLGKVARVAFSTLDAKMADRRFNEEGLHNQAGLVAFKGQNGSSTPTPSPYNR